MFAKSLESSKFWIIKNWSFLIENPDRVGVKNLDSYYFYIIYF